MHRTIRGAVPRSTLFFDRKRTHSTLSQCLLNAVTGEVRTRQCGSSDEDDGSIISSSGFPVL